MNQNAAYQNNKTFIDCYVSIIQEPSMQCITLFHEPRPPCGVFKHSHLGQEIGRWGMSACLEPKTLTERP
ncbi:acyl-CoA reductase-like NAD-dependent aldehyde dehydrogenase [Herbaspirillum sp. Sphag1AN]|nr:acyl-CoA reductase-like NAD-dependent aldehyde dehydrogenase [Herbaspirillum sp. Sphag1AN]MBB3244197.1 acyl-CoA reductase-like NAD-dependent aldehyde dehydrogenase [Herbaspirillum sp. Sphag64]